MPLYNYHGKANLCGSRVRQAREQLGISQAELAARMQVEEIKLYQRSISRLEIGERFVPDYELCVLAKVLKVDVKWLLGLTE